MCWTLQELEKFCYTPTDGKVYLILHSYELLWALWGVALFVAPHPVWIGILLGMTVHVLLDQLFNRTHIFAYFWFYRAWFGFPHKVFYRDELIPKQDRFTIL